MEAVVIFGVRVQRMRADNAHAHLLNAIQSRVPLSVAFANANLLNLSYRDAELRLALRRSFVLNDGVGINAAAKYLNKLPFPDNLNGTDFVPSLLDRAPAGLRVYLLGALPEINAKAADLFKARWPQHELAGARHGYFDAESRDAVVQDVKAAEPHVVLVAMGNSLQEKLSCQIVDQVPTVALSVGALFDFWTERHPRAPLWMRRAGAEWVYRLWREPGRMWQRYLVGNPLFLGRVWRQAMKKTGPAFVDSTLLPIRNSIERDETGNAKTVI